MSAEDLKKALNSSKSLRDYWMDVPGSMEDSAASVRIEIIALIEQERKAAVEEYIAANNEVGECQSIDEKKRDKRQLIIELIKAGLSGGKGYSDAWGDAIYLAERLDKL